MAPKQAVKQRILGHFDVHVRTSVMFVQKYDGGVQHYAYLFVKFHNGVYVAQWDYFEGGAVRQTAKNEIGMVINGYVMELIEMSEEQIYIEIIGRDRWLPISLV